MKLLRYLRYYLIFSKIKYSNQKRIKALLSQNFHTNKAIKTNMY